MRPIAPAATAAGGAEGAACGDSTGAALCGAGAPAADCGDAFDAAASGAGATGADAAAFGGGFCSTRQAVTTVKPTNAASASCATARHERSRMSANPCNQNFGEYMSGERCLTAAVPAEEAK